MSQQEQLVELSRENAELREQLEIKSRLATKAAASYQQRALQMELIRQQNEDLDQLATELAAAKSVAEERAREVERAAKLKSEFLANFSHEIRTPLNGVLGYCDLLMREEGERLTPHGRRDLNTIRNNAQTLLELINDILDLSKIESGHVDVVKESINLIALIDECMATVREYLKGKDVELRSSVSTGLEWAFTDGLKLKRILLNLLTNAAKFTDIGEINVEVKADDDHLCFLVHDTGSGIPSDQLPHIFEKFRQVDGSFTRAKGGSGLGLAIVHELSRLLGGSVSVRSSVGRGSTFEVRVAKALDPSASPRASEPRNAPPDPDVARVLVVDDDPMIQSLLSSRLGEDGSVVIPARDGIEALELARKHIPDVIILDIGLPRLDGWTVLSQLKSEPELRDIPVVILSVEEQRSRGFSLGAFEYLVKPVQPDRLAQVVFNAVGRRPGDILVVDDDRDTRELVGRRLRGEGFKVKEVSSGEEALLRIRVTPPALVILDLVMPGLDGFDVLQQLRESDIECPVVVLTGKELSAQERETLKSGFALVISKGGSAIEEVVAETKRFVAAHRELKKANLPKVLYVEDIAQNRDIVRRYLDGVVELIEATDGEHGLEIARLQQPNLVLMDLSLPRLDGWETTKRLKANDSLQAIPVVALTAHASAEDRERARDVGCCDYLTKPVERDDLLTAIRRHITQGSP